MSEYKYSDFWMNVGDTYAADDPLGAVCWDGAPPWFNRFFARCQLRAVERAMTWRFGTTRAAGRALDLGCGTGRWTRWLDSWGGAATGVDLSPGMLAAADRAHPYALGDVTSLPFRDGSFDLTLSVTVLLHLPPEAQARAVAEIARVLAAGGTFVMLEMIRPVANRVHVFPHDIAGWQRLLRGAGLDVVRSEGEAYAPLLRAGFALRDRFAGNAGDGIGEAKRGGSAGASASAIAGLRGPALVAARAAVAASTVIEPVAARLLPEGSALNVCLVAQKRA